MIFSVLRSSSFLFIAEKASLRLNDTTKKSEIMWILKEIFTLSRNLKQTHHDWRRNWDDDLAFLDSSTLIK